MSTDEITNYIFIEDTELQGDVALVFGTWDIWAESLNKAAELYTSKLVPKVVVSSGFNPRSGVNEADLMAKKLEELGVPAFDILIENNSTNTLENVLFSKNLIDKNIGLNNIDSLVAVVKNYHSRRALMTLRKHLPYHIQLKSAAYISDKYPFTRQNWQESEVGKEKVSEELAKIESYLKKGDLIDL